MKMVSVFVILGTLAQTVDLEHVQMTAMTVVDVMMESASVTQDIAGPFASQERAPMIATIGGTVMMGFASVILDSLI